MLREIALYETLREEWAHTEARLHLEREALAARQSMAQTPETQHGIGRMLRRLAGMADRRPPTRRAPLAS